MGIAIYVGQKGKLKMFKCKICNEKIGYNSFYYGTGLCKSCSHKGIEHASNWKGGHSIRYCIDCNKKLTATNINVLRCRYCYYIWIKNPVNTTNWQGGIAKENKKKYRKQWGIEHKKERNIKEKQQRIKNISIRLLGNLRSRITRAIKMNTKSNHTMKLIGCNIDFLKFYIEKQFKSGMTWKNYGTGWYGKGMQEWHIDHIIPCNAFDLCIAEQQKLCFHYSNLQPLWATENLQKNKIDKTIFNS